jgi:hypothetical protein
VLVLHIPQLVQRVKRRGSTLRTICTLAGAAIAVAAIAVAAIAVGSALLRPQHTTQLSRPVVHVHVHVHMASRNYRATMVYGCVCNYDASLAASCAAAAAARVAAAPAHVVCAQRGLPAQAAAAVGHAVVVGLTEYELLRPQRLHLRLERGVLLAERVDLAHVPG